MLSLPTLQLLVQQSESSSQSRREMPSVLAGTLLTRDEECGRQTDAPFRPAVPNLTATASSTLETLVDGRGNRCGGSTGLADDLPQAGVRDPPYRHPVVASGRQRRPTKEASIVPRLFHQRRARRPDPG